MTSKDELRADEVCWDAVEAVVEKERCFALLELRWQQQNAA